MAKNITLMGADYPNVPAVQLPQTGGGTATFYDIEMKILDGSFASYAGFAQTIQYPDGFNKDNTFVVSININNGTTWRYGVGITVPGDYERTFVDLQESGIRAYTDMNGLFGQPFRICIMKI